MSRLNYYTGNAITNDVYSAALYRSIHCIDLFLDPYDILSMHPLPVVYIINQSGDTFNFDFVENLSKKHVVNTHLCLI